MEIAAVTVVEIAVATAAAEAVVDAGDAAEVVAAPELAAEAAAEAVVVAADAIRVDKAAAAIFPRQNTLLRKVAIAAAHRAAVTKIAVPGRPVRAIAVLHRANRVKTISFCPAKILPSIVLVPFSPLLPSRNPRSASPISKKRRRAQVRVNRRYKVDRVVSPAVCRTGF